MKVKLQHPVLEYCEQHDGSDFMMLPGVMEVCPTCNGTGSHDRRDLDCSLLVESMQADGDHEGVQDYMNGYYSQTCEQCKGKNVVGVPNWNLVPNWAKIAIEEWDKSEQESKAIEAAERAVGA
jgi:DnaJ-class molecular chaperone